MGHTLTNIKVRQAEIKSVPSVSTRYGKSTCGKMRNFKSNAHANAHNHNATQCQKFAFTAFCTNYRLREKITNAIIYNMSGCVNSGILYTDLGITYI